MIPTEEQYKEALETVKAYEDEKRKTFLEKVELSRKDLQELFVDTHVKDFFIREHKRYDKSMWVEVVVIVPAYDEDYSGEFDKDFKKIGEKNGIEIHMESGAWSK